jgi:hypothetical protein
MGASFEKDYEGQGAMIEGSVGHPAFDLARAVESDAGAIHNFDGDAANQFRLNAIAIGPTAASGREMVGQTIAVKYFYIHQVESVDARGEISRWPRCVLITAEGLAYSFGSWGVFDMLKLMIRHFGRTAWNPPRVVKVKQVTTRSGNTMLTLDMVS